jgi:hypothetical protein
VTGRSDGARGARHIIGEVQRFGLLSAASVVDRYVEIISRESVGDPLRHAREALGGTSEGSVVGAARMLEVGLQALDASARLISDAVAAGTEPLVLPPTEPGLASEASVWIHNRTSSLVASVQLHPTVLVSTEESSIPHDAVRFRPEEAVLVEPGTCREVTVRVSVPEGQPLGLYHGLLMGSGAPDGAITVRLAVQGPGGGST